MLRLQRSALALAVTAVGAIGLSSLLLDAAACSGNADAPQSNDGSIGDDASNGGDARALGDDAGHDATTSDAAEDTGAEAASDGGGDSSADAAIDCPSLLAKMFASPIAPPNRWLGLDLSNGGLADGGAGGGGLTIDQAGILACASSVEPDALDGGGPLLPGARTAIFTNDAGASLVVSYNLESRVIWQATTNAPATSTLTFHARAGGAYDHGAPDGGTSVYVIGFGGGDGGTGYASKDGADFPADWTVRKDDAGADHASAWANEIYDGLMATYAPSVAPVVDCLSATVERPSSAHARESACFAFSGYLGVRPLGTYLQFEDGTNHAQSMYEVWSGGWPSCATPRAALDNFENLPIQPTGNGNTATGPLWSGTAIGTLTAAEPIANPAGLLATEANTIMGCGAVTVTAPDPGYGAEQWGAGEAEVEYNLDSGVAYKVIARQGYRGALDVVSATDDGGTNEYLVQVGSLTRNGAPVTLDWAGGDAGTLNAAVTDISNGWLAFYCGVTDQDCVQAGDCTIVPDDGHGHSTFTLLTSPSLAAYCGDLHPLTFVFATGSSAPAEIQATNPAAE